MSDDFDADIGHSGDVGAAAPTWAVFGDLMSVMLGAFVLIMLGVIGVQIGASRRYDGPFGKSDRAFAFGAIGLLLGGGVPTGAWLAWLLWAMVALSAWTALNRARNALAELRAREAEA